MIKNTLAVTENPLLNQYAGLNFFTNASEHDAITGIYLSTDSNRAISPERLRGLINLVQAHDGRPPDCYLLLELSHKGRVDARLFADAQFTVTMPFSMQEDGDPMPNHARPE